MSNQLWLKFSQAWNHSLLTKNTVYTIAHKASVADVNVLFQVYPAHYKPKISELPVWPLIRALYNKVVALSEFPYHEQAVFILTWQQRMVKWEITSHIIFYLYRILLSNFQILAAYILGTWNAQVYFL